MPINAKEIIKIMEELAPNPLALEYDNVGLIIGDRHKEVRRILVALDLDDEVADKAIEMKADFVITHHPLIFKPIKEITCDTALGRRIVKLIKNDIAVYASHTNLDIAWQGTNDVLFDLLQLRSESKEGLFNSESEAMWLGRVGMLENSISLHNFCLFVKDKLGLMTINYTGNPETIIQRVGLCTGAAADYKYIKAAVKKNCDVYITGDVTYHYAQAAYELGIALIDGTHFATEILIVSKLAEYLKERLNNAGVDITACKADNVLRSL